ncbi:hypothetical protein LIA77_07008 [Sarocladium implicatum]|nr:hypothetical protein LIA77_07008 [Sarocladium implicatum]
MRRTGLRRVFTSVVACSAAGNAPVQDSTAQHSTYRFKGWWRAPLRGAGCCTATLSASASPAGEVSGRWLERQLLQGFNTGQWGARLAVGNLTAGRSVCFKFRLSTEGIGAGGVKSIDREMRKERCHEVGSKSPRPPPRSPPVPSRPLALLPVTTHIILLQIHLRNNAYQYHPSSTAYAQHAAATGFRLIHILTCAAFRHAKSKSWHAEVDGTGLRMGRLCPNGTGPYDPDISALNPSSPAVAKICLLEAAQPLQKPSHHLACVAVRWCSQTLLAAIAHDPSTSMEDAFVFSTWLLRPCEPIGVSIDML